MKLSANDLFQLSQCAISAAYQAGSLISKYKHQSFSISSKTNHSSLASQVVTEVDRLSQELILQTLAPTCQSFDLALLTEESPDQLERLEKDYFWCIDPLDGTLPYVENSHGYSVSIALVSRSGVPHIGVVYDPVEQTLYSAIKDQGAYRNGKPWDLEACLKSAGTSFTFICDRSFVQHPLFSETINGVKSLASKMGYEQLNSTIHGGAAMHACWVLENLPACYIKYPKLHGGGSLWDYAATACLFLEAGAIVSDIYGKPLDLNRADSTFMNHRGILYTHDRSVADGIIALYVKLQ